MEMKKPTNKSKFVVCIEDTQTKTHLFFNTKKEVEDFINEKIGESVDFTDKDCFIEDYTVHGNNEKYVIYGEENSKTIITNELNSY